MSLNIELLEKVKAHILAEPRRFCMHNFIQHFNSWDKTYVDDKRMEQLVPECRTVACIAGWAVELGDSVSPVYTRRCSDIESRAKTLLGLEDSRLFFVDEWWDTDAAHAYYLAKTPAERAAIAAGVIDSVIKDAKAEGNI